MKWFKTDGYHLPIALAIGLHGSIVAVSLFAVDFGSSEPPAPKRPPIVNATVIDVSQTIIGQREAEERAAQQREAQALADQKKKDAEQARKKKETERRALEEKQKQLAQAKQAREQAEAAKKELARQQEAAKKQQIAKNEAAKKQAQELERKRLAEQKLADEKRRKALADKAEADRVAEQERKRQEEAARIAAEEKAKEEAAQEAAAAEAAKKQAAEEAQMVQSISSLINNRVTAAWIRPPSARNNMKTQLRIYFLPNGEVMNVQITRGSGDALFDQRAVDAVYKVRKIDELAEVDSYVFERNFRQVDLIFNPQDLRN